MSQTGQISDGTTAGEIPGHDRAGRFTAGNSAHHEKRRRIADRVAELSADYDAKSAASQMLLRIAAEFIDQAERTRSHAIRTRAMRAAGKILDRLQRKPEPPPPTLEEMLAAAEGTDG
jgi:hypothetical protein